MTPVDEIPGTPLSPIAVTHRHLVALFAAHCECRPLDPTRREDEHSHDCDTGILADVQEARAVVADRGPGRVPEDDPRYAAVVRCAEQWDRDLASPVYARRLAYAWRVEAGEPDGPGEGGAG